MQLDVAREGWLMEARLRRRTPQTVDLYARLSGRFVGWCGEQGVQRVEDLRADHLRRFLLDQGTWASITANRSAGMLKAWGRWMAEEDIVPHDPFRKVKRPTIERAELRVLTPSEAGRLLAAFNKRHPEGLRNYTMVLLALDTGLRNGEIRDAKYADLKLEQQWLQVWGKGRKQRRVPLSDEVCKALWKYVHTVRVRKPNSPYLFVSKVGGQVDHANLCESFHRALREAGITHRVRFHDLRHTAATWSLRAGMPKERVSRLLGHANDSITSIYEHLDFDDVQAAHREANPLRLLA